MTNPANPGKDPKMLNEVFECNPNGFPEVETAETDAHFDGYLSDEEIAEYLTGVVVSEIDFDEVVVADNFIEDVAAGNAFLEKFMLGPIGEQMEFAFRDLRKRRIHSILIASANIMSTTTDSLMTLRKLPQLTCSVFSSHSFL